MSFKRKVSLTDRKAECKKMLYKYNDRIPVILESDNIKLDKIKYLVPNNINVSHFTNIVKKRVCNSVEEYKSNSFIITFDNTIPTASETLQSLYDKYKDKDDSFLYGKLLNENTFG
ncbi:MAG: hypothetical protein ACW98X_12090 [Promethearchaeota archaeon]|jgi:hypothetical protein